ncbi:hypothetical protein [Bradyrhizobium sp. LHD-71]|uniref:hypothetical protein n=1 Tax=Bradyrhizobium sp. LHD-71 TaxID=3072141 RepID=UPI00280C526F|nr:hypothetical protein [Bradyrhizobium sp. LHD-71]MDQ8729500.1 hypothetical protein [Bradyrhizobium sp. LHD-71]
MDIEPNDFSSFIVRTVDGLRVAVAGLPQTMPVDVTGVVLDAMTIEDLRALTTLPHPLSVLIPHRLADDSRVQVGAAEESERDP